jgi:hypothetical protein
LIADSQCSETALWSGILALLHKPGDRLEVGVKHYGASLSRAVDD